MTTFQLYTILKLDAVIGLCIGISSIFAAFTIISWIAYGIMSEDGDNAVNIKFGKFLRSWTPWAIVTVAIFTLGATFTPTTQQAAVITVVPKIVNAVTSNKELMALPEDLVHVASSWIKELHLENAKSDVKAFVEQVK